MINIKNSYADCGSCELYDCSSCILETNCEDDLTKVDIIFIAENPGKDEVSSDPPIPLIGRSGQIFRKYFKKYKLDKLKYLITNVVLCQTLTKDGNTTNPSDEIIERCKINCFNIINICKPKLIVLMGASPAKAFGIFQKGSTMTSLRGNVFKWNGYDIFLTFHPSYVNRQKTEEIKFDQDLKKVAELMGISLKDEIKVVSKIKNYKNEPFYYKIPDKYYTSNYKLIDIQFLKKSNEVLYIFRDKNNKKEFYKTNDEYVCYQIDDESKARKIVPYSDLHQLKISYKEKYSLDPKITYEGDLKITTKHAIDYYLLKKNDDPDVPLNIMFLDIETYSKTKAMSNAIDVEDSIVIIRYSYNGIKKSLVLDPNKVGITDQKINTNNKEIVICKTEVQLLNTFFNDVRNLDVDIISGWFSNEFDMQYIFNRGTKLGVDISKISRFGEAEFNKYQYYPDAAGIVFLDMLELYKSFTFGGRESYSLDFISNLELKKGKTNKGENFSDLFRNDINKAIDYNINDVDLLEGLHEKLNHIFIQDELKKTCRNTFRGSKAAMGQLDSLIVSYLKEKGFSSKNADVHGDESKFEGAFVQSPIVGVHDYVVDFDFTSLYPSLIITYNIGVNTFVMKFKDTQLGYDITYCPEKLPDKMEVFIDPLFTNKLITITKDQLMEKIKSSNLIYTINGCFYKNHSTEISYYSEILDMLMSARKQYKKKMFEYKMEKNKAKEQLFDSRQLIAKTLANSIYGILGNKVYRFFNIDLARSITLSGQEAIKNVMISAENFIKSKINKSDIKNEYITKQQMFSDNLGINFENLVTGDTDSVFITYKRLTSDKNSSEKNLEIVNELNKEIQFYLNNNIVKGIVNKHNVDLEKNRLELKNELVIKRGLFLAKKRYANFIISQEGNPVSEIKGMGIETKRSDFSHFTKDYLNKLLEIILKSETVSIPKIVSFVKEKEKIFMQLLKERYTVVGRPVSFGKKFEDYKTISQGVRGMINWNNLQYKAFDVGSRGYLFKIKGIDIEKAPKNIVENYDKYFSNTSSKLDVIVVPENEQYVPEWYIIDSKVMVNFAWTDRYNLLIDPLITKNQDILKF